MIVAGTGHRPHKLGGHKNMDTARLLSVATTALEELDPRIVISGMAIGWDQALAEAALNLGIRLWAYVPHRGQENIWPSHTQEHYRALLARAEKEVLIHRGKYTAACMHQRNRRMVEDADLLLALWDGTPGGTQSTVTYAEKIGTPVVNVWPVWLGGFDEDKV